MNDGDLTNAAGEILELAKAKGALEFGTFTLSSGKVSPYYFDGRLITLDPEGANRVGNAFLSVLAGDDVDAVAGPTLGADPIVSAVSVLSYQQGHPVAGLVVRDGAKEHGAQRQIEGPIRPGMRVVVVDDACTTGGSLLRTIEAVESAGCAVVKVLCILDRREGGSDKIRGRGYPFVALLQADQDGNITPVVEVEEL